MTDINTSEAERLIATGEPPLAIKTHFHSFRDAVRFYAEVRSRQYAAGMPLGKCCGCDQPADGVIVEMRWAAAFSRWSWGRTLLMSLALLVHLHIGFKKEWIAFCSVHRFCPACWRRFQKLRFASGYVEASTFVVTFTAAAFAAGLGVAALVLDHLPASSRIELWLACAGCVFIAILGFLTRIGYRQWGVPASVRPVAPRPFRLMHTRVMKKVMMPGTAAGFAYPR